jgi:hypothetical protein
MRQGPKRLWFVTTKRLITVVLKILHEINDLTYCLNLGKDEKRAKGRPQFDFAGREFSTKLSTD